MNKLKELYIYIRKKGIKDTLQRIYSNYFHVLTFVLYKRELDDGFSGIMLDSEYKVVIDDLEFLRRVRENRDDLPREFYIDHTHGYKRFYLVICGEEPVFILWVFGKGDYSRVCDIREESTVELAYAYTMPKYRGKRLVAKVLNFTCEDLKNRGYKRVVNVVSTSNVNCHRGMGFSGLKVYQKVKSYFSFVKKIKV